MSNNLKSAWQASDFLVLIQTIWMPVDCRGWNGDSAFRTTNRSKAGKKVGQETLRSLTPVIKHDTRGGEPGRAPNAKMTSWNNSQGAPTVRLQRSANHGWVDHLRAIRINVPRSSLTKASRGGSRATGATHSAVPLGRTSEGNGANRSVKLISARGVLWLDWHIHQCFGVIDREFWSDEMILRSGRPKP